MNSLNEIFNHARDYGNPEASALVKAWDAATNLDPETALEAAESDDLREQLADYERINDELEEKLLRAEERASDLKSALVQLRWNAFFGTGRTRDSSEFDDSYDYFDGSNAEEAIREYAPDIYDDIVAAYVKVDDGEIAEIWVSMSFSSNVPFERIY